MAVAGESAEFASSDASKAVSPSSVLQVTADMQRLARRYSAVPPLEFLGETRQTRDQARRLAERTRKPGQLAELHLATGATCGLMAVASFDLAAWAAAIEQSHAAYTYGEIAGHRGLQAWAAGFQGLIAYWCGRPRDAVDLIRRGLDLAPPGTAQARLHCVAARAWAHLGANEQVREELEAGDRARDTIGSTRDELHDDIAGEFGWGAAQQEMCAASALLLIGDADGAAARAAEAIRLAGTDHTGSLIDVTARVDLAHAEVARSALDAAQYVLDPVWELAPGHRRYSVVQRMDDIATALAAPAFARTPLAGELAEQIRVFTAASAPQALNAPDALDPGGQ